MGNALLKFCPALVLLALLAGCGDFFVSGNSLVSIAIMPTAASIQPGKTQQFTATGTFGDGSTRNITSQVTWTSSQISIATISSSGLATAVALGSTTITATSNAGSSGSKVTANTTLTVSNQVLTTIAITPANSSLRVGTTQQFTATGTFSDGSTRDITGSVTWASSNTAVATITTGGLASAVSAGSTVISATSGSITVTTNLTVTAT